MSDVRLPDGLTVRFDGWEPRIGPDGVIRWWAQCAVVPAPPGTAGGLPA